jgi:hypothetical protein
MGMWALWMPGFMQFLTGMYLLTGLTWFQVFNVPTAKTSALYNEYMKGVAARGYADFYR